MSFVIPLGCRVLVLSLLLGLRPAAAQLGVPDAGAAKAVNACHKAVTAATASYAAATYKSFKTCADTTFVCVQLKPFDAKCLPKATEKCAKEAAKRDGSFAAKLRTAVEKKCNEGQIPFATLRSAAGANLALLDDACSRLFVGPVTDVGKFEDCTLRAARCRVEEAIEFAMPRADALLASTGTALHSDFCPRPTPTPTPIRTRTPTKTRTPTPTKTRTPTPGGVTPTPTPTLTATPTASDTATPTASDTATPTATTTTVPTVTPTPTATVAATATTTLTATGTPSASPTLTPTATRTPTPTATPTVTSTPTDTETPTPTATETPNVTPTDTETPAETPSETPTPSDTPTP